MINNNDNYNFIPMVTIATLKVALKMYARGSKLYLTKSMTPKKALAKASEITGNHYKLTRVEGQRALDDIQHLIDLNNNTEGNA